MKFIVSQIKPNLFFLAHENIIIVQSYNQNVALIDTKENVLVVLDEYFSTTTSKHLNLVRSRCENYREIKQKRDDFDFTVRIKA